MNEVINDLSFPVTKRATDQIRGSKLIITKQKQDILQVPIQCVTMRDPQLLAKQMNKDQTPTDDEQTSAEQTEPTETGEASNEEVGAGIARLKELLFAIQDDRAVPFWITTGISSETNIEVEGEGVAESMQVVCGNFKTLNRELKPNDLLEIAPEGQNGPPEK